MINFMPINPLALTVKGIVVKTIPFLIFVDHLYDYDHSLSPLYRP